MLQDRETRLPRGRYNLTRESLVRAAGVLVLPRLRQGEVAGDQRIAIATFGVTVGAGAVLAFWPGGGRHGEAGEIPVANAFHAWHGLVRTASWAEQVGDDELFQLALKHRRW